MKEKYDHRLLLKHLPSDFKQFMEHLQVLEYADKPDYGEYCHKIYFLCLPDISHVSMFCFQP